MSIKSFFAYLLNLLNLFIKSLNRLPHPEEAQDTSKTVANTNIDSVIQDWFKNWKVPQKYHSYWKNNVCVHIFDTWPADVLNTYKEVLTVTPSFVVEIDGIRHLYSLASWFNKGVMAHEMAHNSYSYLSSDQKISFELAFNSVSGDDWIIKLRRLKSYMDKTNAMGLHVEGHAEIYRYRGEYMPASLKKFYPKLF